MSGLPIRIGSCIGGGSFEKYAELYKEMGYESLSVNFHMSYGDTNLEELAEKTKGILPISGIGLYCNPLQYEEHFHNLERFIDLAEKFGTNLVTTFAGALEGQSVEASMPQFKKVFGELTKRAEDRGVRIAIENCPMGGSWYHCTCNIGFNPMAWDMMFNEVTSDALGLEWEPAHQMHQLIDPIAVLRKYAGKVYHLHGKDAQVRHDLIRTQGICGPKPAVISRVPGCGDCDWREIMGILMESGIKNEPITISVENEDPVLSGDRYLIGQQIAVNYLKQCRGV